LAKKHKIGLVLSGGGTRGYAHLGAVKALYEKDIVPEIISGVSAGAIVGAFLADKKDPEEIFLNLKKKRIFDYSKVHVPKNSLLSLEGLKKDLENNISVKNLEDLGIPFTVAAANISEGKIEYFDKGVIADLVVASSSIPVLFSPIKMKNAYYVDGGLFDNLPVTPIKDKCKKVIGIHINPIQKENEFPNLFKIASRAFHLSVHSTIKESKEMCDVFIEPEKLHEYEILDTKKADELYEIGYEYVSKMKF